MSDVLLNKDELLDEFEDSLDILESMLPKFEKGIKDSVTRIEEMLSTGKVDSLKDELHSLKGMVGTLFSPKLYELVAGSEQMALNGETENVAQNISDFKSSLPVVITMINDILSRAAV